MFAGDKVKPAADASYRNFDAGPSFHIGSNVRRNNEIGTIDSWGPLFRISLDLMIHSHVEDKWSSVLTFKGNGGASDHEKFGDRIPGIFVYKDINKGKGYLQFSTTKLTRFFFPINLNTWYNILIEQKNRKVMLK